MRNDIENCRKLNPSWGSRKIAKHLGLPRSTVDYHLSSAVKAGVARRNSRLRANNALLKKCDNFLNKKALRSKADDFQRRSGRRDVKFTYHDVLSKFGDKPVCYLTGDTIDLSKPRTFSLDHVTPRSKGGLDSLDNLGLLRSDVNQMKSDLTVPEFIALCKKVLEHSGFQVIGSIA